MRSSSRLNSLRALLGAAAFAFQPQHIPSRLPPDWHLAKVTDDRAATWLGVELLDGLKGFVHRDQTVNPLGYRAVFEKRGGKWTITAFIAGD